MQLSRVKEDGISVDVQTSYPFLKSSSAVDFCYASVIDEPELLDRNGSFETQLGDETQQLIRFSI